MIMIFEMLINKTLLMKWNIKIFWNKILSFETSNGSNHAPTQCIVAF